MINTPQDEHKNTVLTYLDECIRFQKKWQVLMMALYCFTTVGALLCGFTATILGALNYGVYASFFAGFGTVMITVEKSLMFREKWRLHLRINTALRNLKMDLLTDQIDIPRAIERLKETLERYVADLPFETRTPEQITSL